MGDRLSEKSKSRLAVSNAFNQFQLVDLSLDQPIIERESKPCDNCCLIPFNAQDKALKFWDLALTDLSKPVIELLSGACAQHPCKLLDEPIGDISLWMKLPQPRKRFLFIDFQFFRSMKKQEGCLS